MIVAIEPLYGVSLRHILGKRDYGWEATRSSYEARRTAVLMLDSHLRPQNVFEIVGTRTYAAGSHAYPAPLVAMQRFMAERCIRNLLKAKQI